MFQLIVWTNEQGIVTDTCPVILAPVDVVCYSPLLAMKQTCLKLAVSSISTIAQ